MSSYQNFFSDRRYGFVRLIGPSAHAQDAFFHFSVLKDHIAMELKIGDELEVETVEHRGGKGLQVRRVLNVLTWS